MNYFIYFTLLYHCLSLLLRGGLCLDSMAQKMRGLRHFPRFFHDMGVPGTSAALQVKIKDGG